ncbi:MAG: type II toxin-antitoxin system VapC family toxin [Thiolinea sp.]
MIAIDTNLLVRALTDDEESPDQTEQARALINAAGRVFVPQIVQVEFVWVLEQAYGLDKQKIIEALEVLLKNPVYELQHTEHFELALARFRQSNAGFADLIVAVESQQANLVLWTFDRKLSKQEGVERLLPESLAKFHVTK